MCTVDDYLGKAKVVNEAVKNQLNRKSIRYNWHEADVTVLEGVFARGDRRVADVIEAAYRKGEIFDAWTENFRYQVWLDTFEECGLSIDFYTTRTRELDELFPWDFIDTGVTKEFFIREWKRAQQAVTTKNCRQGCAGCGARKFGGGVCFENTNAVC